MASVREIKEGNQEQGTEEEVNYTLTVPTTWGAPTGTPTVKAYSFDATTSAYTDVTATLIPTGSATVLGQVISLPEIKAMTADVLYRIEVKFACANGDVKEAYAWIQCRR